MRTIRIFVLLTAVMLTGLFAQNPLKVVKIETLTSPQQGLFFYPKLTPDGENVLFTGPQFTGLYVLNLKDKKIEVLNREPGAGYEYQISADGQYVYYRTSTFIRYKKYYSLKKQALHGKGVQILEAQVRNLQPPRLVKNTLMYLKDERPVQKTVTPVLQKSNASTEKAVFVGERNLLLIVDGEKRTLAPLGEGIYIWPSLSPDGQQILFTFGGDGTYVCDLDGNILSKIGYANAPVWSPDGKWIAYMVDHDNGDYFTDSEIFISSVDGKQKIQVTDTPDIIEMYPSWGAKLSQLVFASNRGQIFMATLKTE